MSKLKVVFYWAASCGGCEVSLLDTNEKVVELGAIADILLMPLAFDGKYSDIEKLKDGEIDVTFFNGGTRSSEHEHLARLLRQKSKVMIAYGACASWGGVPGLANQYHAEEIMKCAYEETASIAGSNPSKDRPQLKTAVPEGELDLPKLYDRVFPLDEVVKVDYYLPGCPPNVEWIAAAIDAIASGKLPPAGSVIGSSKTICDECKREKSSDRKIKKFHRVHEIITDPKKCLLEQGVICSGPATRAGCGGAKCLDVNMPCRGCYGPPPGVIDQGAKLLSVVASMIDANEEEEIEKILSDIKDTIGTFYQFTLPKSILKGGVK